MTAVKGIREALVTARLRDLTSPGNVCKGGIAAAAAAAELINVVAQLPVARRGGGGKKKLLCLKA